MAGNGIGFGVSATLLELSILAQTIGGITPNPCYRIVLFLWVGNKQILKYDK